MSLEHIGGNRTASSAYQTSGSYGAASTAGAGQSQTTSKNWSDLQPGELFTGEIQSVKGDQVTIKLESGETMQARLTESIPFKEGETVTFYVKSNSSGQIAIKPVSDKSMVDNTILKVLQGNGLTVNAKNMNLVGVLLENQMSVDKRTIQTFLRQMAIYPMAEAEDLVRMAKLNIPINEDNIIQFQNYQNQNQSIVGDMKQIIDSFSELSNAIASTGDGNKSLIFQKELLSIILMDKGMASNGTAESGATIPLNNGIQSGGNAVEGSILNGTVAMEVSNTGHPVSAQMSRNNVAIPEGVNVPETTVVQGNNQSGNLQPETAVVNGNLATEKVNVNGHPIPETTFQGEGQTIGLNSNTIESVKTDLQGDIALAREHLATQDNSVAMNTTSSNSQTKQVFPVLSEVLSPSERETLSLTLSKGDIPEATVKQLTDGTMTTKDILQWIHQNLNVSVSKELLQSEPYQKLLKSHLDSQWFLQPENVATKNAVSDMYKHLSGQMERLTQLAQSMGDSANSSLGQHSSNLKQNLDFMNQINQLMNYVQIPLQLNGKQMHSDLYVFANKKSKNAEKDCFRALLHLDMEELGSMDIHVELRQKSADIHFYLSNELIVDFILSHAEQLENRLTCSGYHTNIRAEKAEETKNVIEHIMEENDMSPSSLQKYTFNVRV